MAVFVGLDIGGTKIMVAAADQEGNILRRARTDTSTSLEEDLSNLNNMIAEVAGADQILGMGAAMTWIMQIHMSWPLLLPFAAVAVYMRGLLNAVWLALGD